MSSQDNSIDDLREHLFATIAALRDKEAPMDIDRAKAVSEVAQTMINLAKVEVDYAKVTGADIDSKFLRVDKSDQPALPNASAPRITTHRLK